MGTLIQDLKYGFRMLAKNPGFTTVAVLTLALGIGANTAIFSVVYGVLLRPLPYSQPDRIVRVYEVTDVGNRVSFPDPNFEDLRAGSRTLEGLAEYSSGVESVSGGAEPARVMVAAVSRDFFPVMGVAPVIGRGFAPEEQREGGTAVALVSYGYWQQYLGASTDLSKFKLTDGDHVFSVIGVLPPGFRFPDSAELWVPRELFPRLPSRTAHNWSAIGRLRSGVPLASAQAEMTGVAARLRRAYPTDNDMTGVAAVRLQDALTGQVRPALVLLLGAVGLLLLVATANVANLMLAQALGRARETSIRAALGAERLRLVRQFLTEALLVSLLGGGVGVLAAFWSFGSLVALVPEDVPLPADLRISQPVLFFSLALTVLCAAALGVFTALRATAGNPQVALGEAGRGQGISRRSRGWGRALAAAQLAVTMVLLVGGGLLARSLYRVLAIDPGYRTEHIVTMDLSLPWLGWLGNDAARIQRVRFLDDLFSRLATIPGVEAVGGTNALPLGETLADGTFVLLGPSEMPARTEDLAKLFEDRARTGQADYCVSNEGFFRVLGVPLVRGRLFDARDTIEAPHVAVISQSLARVRWPNQDPIGHTIEFGNMDGDPRLLTIVGMVGDVRNRRLETPPRPTVYVDYRQRPTQTSHFTVVLSSAGAPAPVLSAAREILRQLDPNVPPRFATFAEVFSASVESRRFDLILVGAFAATALLLAVAGIYGVMSYSVGQRTQEIGVRMALGADAANVQKLVVGEGVVVTLAGLGVGLVGALALTRFVTSYLYGVNAADPVTYLVVSTVLAAVAVLACYVPARRASKVDPMVALRCE